VRNVVWTAVLSVVLLVAAIVVILVWEDHHDLGLALAIGSATMSILSLREEG
jgi:hypothetical protein